MGRGGEDESEIGFEFSVFAIPRWGGKRKVLADLGRGLFRNLKGKKPTPASTRGREGLESSQG